MNMKHFSILTHCSDLKISLTHAQHMILSSVIFNQVGAERHEIKKNEVYFTKVALHYFKEADIHYLTSN